MWRCRGGDIEKHLLELQRPRHGASDIEKHLLELQRPRHGCTVPAPAAVSADDDHGARGIITQVYQLGTAGSGTYTASTISGNTNANHFWKQSSEGPNRPDPGQ
jgi:hypothetical protein